MTEPPAVVTETGPLTAPDGTSTEIFLALSLMMGAVTPSVKVTPVALEKLAPSIVTLVPIDPEAGANLVMLARSRKPTPYWYRPAR